MTVYPDDAPAAPTPEPTGNVQTFTTRVAIVRGYVQPTTDLTVPAGVGAVRFTIPQEEQLSGRTFAIVVFAAGKKHHQHLLAADTSATLSGNTVTSAVTNSPLALKKGTGYLFMLYGDPAPATPPPTYSGVGNNPFPAPTYATGAPGVPGAPGAPGSAGGAPYTSPPYGQPTSVGQPTPAPPH